MKIKDRISHYLPIIRPSMTNKLTINVYETQHQYETLQKNIRRGCPYLLKSDVQLYELRFSA